MAHFAEQVPLPTSVETLIDSICREQNQNPPDFHVRRQLAAIGEHQALHILCKISKNKIRISLSAYILHMIKSLDSDHPSSPSNGACRNSPHKGTIGFGPPHSPASQNRGYSSHGSVDRGEQKRFSPALVALGELEFRKAFLMLSYIGGESLENAITAEKIRSLRELPMVQYEKETWEAVGKRYINHNERRLYLEWDTGRAHVYYCYVSPDGSLKFKGPILHSSWTHLQKSLGDDNVLIVKFAEETNVSNSRTSVQEADALYGKFGKEGIRVGLRLYRFFVFKDGRKEEKKKDPTTSPVRCYFVRTESYSSADERASYILSNKTMFDARSLFMHAHTLASLDKYMARFSLILSQTLKLNIDLATVNVQTIQDVDCKDENGEIVYYNGKLCIHTDGTGYISEDLAVLCPFNVSKGRDLENKYMKEIPNVVELEGISKATGEAGLSTRQPPLLIQCRLFHMGCAIKGTLLVNRKNGNSGEEYI